MSMDYSTLPKASAIPGAAAMIETFRAIGYSLETAVADRKSTRLNSSH